MKSIDLQEQYEAILLEIKDATPEQAIQIVRKLNNLSLQIDCEYNIEKGVFGSDHPFLEEMKPNIC